MQSDMKRIRIMFISFCIISKIIGFMHFYIEIYQENENRVKYFI
jgi:hypothetical protein